MSNEQPASEVADSEPTEDPAQSGEADGGISISGLVNAAKLRLEKFGRTSAGILIGAIVFMLIAFDGLFGFQLIPVIFANIQSLDLRYLAVAGVVVLCLLFLPISRNISARIAIGAVAMLLFIPLGMAGMQPEPDELVIVYDESSRDMSPERLSARTVDIKDIYTLSQVGQIRADSLFVSVVERPAEAWKPVFDQSFRPQKKILSLREVLEGDDMFIDVSSSDFVSEIANILESDTARHDAPHIIFFARGYRTAADSLAKSLRRKVSRSGVTLIAYEGRTTGLFFPENATIIYLGHSAQFADFFRHTSSHAYNLLLAPNWVIGAIKPHGGTENQNRIIAISSPARRLAAADYEMWSLLIDTIRNARQQRANVAEFVGSAVNRDMTIEQYAFDETDLSN